MARRGHLRASDGDREQVAERLRHASAEGRVSTEELEQRVSAALSARTYAELDGLVADLPGRSLTARERRRSELAVVLRPALALAIAIPVAMALVAAIAFLVTGVFAMWMVWVALGWWFFGRHRHQRHGPRTRGPYRYTAAPHCRAAQQRPRSGLWL